MRYILVPLLILLSAVLTQGQSGPCTESSGAQSSDRVEVFGADMPT
jgi:hypothetical protein